MLKKNVFKRINKTNLLAFFVLAIFCCFAGAAFAADQQPTGLIHDIGELARTIMRSFKSLGKLMVAVAYIAGFGFMVAAIFKFKQHKDNPTQVPMTTPLFQTVIGTVMLFLPTMINVGSGTAGLTQAGGFAGSGVEEVPGGKEGTN